MYKKQLTKEQALQKLKHYCGYQERCHSEVMLRLNAEEVSAQPHIEMKIPLLPANWRQICEFGEFERRTCASSL